MPKRKADPFADDQDEVLDETQAQTNGDHIWGQQPGEPSRWYERFVKYLHQGPNRSLYAVYLSEPAKPGSKRAQREDPRPRGGISGAWKTQSEKWDWKERAEAKDKYDLALDQVKWEQNRAAIKAAEWDAFMALSKKGMEMLAVGKLFTRTEERKIGEDGRIVQITNINPTKWTMRDAAQILKAASDIGRLAAGMETSRGTVIVGDSSDVEDLSDYELIAIAAAGRQKNASGDPSDTDAGASGADAPGST
jgi:hypothetical protein